MMFCADVVDQMLASAYVCCWIRCKCTSDLLYKYLAHIITSAKAVAFLLASLLRFLL
jgi:hypothetical protein